MILTGEDAGAEDASWWEAQYAALGDSDGGTINIVGRKSYRELAYLKGEFEQHESVYARPPKDWRHTVRGTPVVWKLKIPLYGEADAGRIWNRTLVRQLRAQRFVQSQFDPCYFRKLLTGGKRVDILMYVDDGYVVTNWSKAADAELKTLHAKFSLKRKPSDYFLGNNIAVAS